MNYRLDPFAARLILLGVALAICAGPARAHDSVNTITSDTPEYCMRLFGRVQALRVATQAPEVALLVREGRTMCENGQTRAGIMRLRRAWMILKQSME